MSARSVTFEIPDQLLEEAIFLEAEMGLPLSVIALSAFEGYLEGVREARRLDVDELRSNVSFLSGPEQSEAMEGTEAWLDAERPASD